MLGVRYRSLEDDGILMPVVDARFSSSHPVRYDTLLTIRTCFPRQLSARIATEYTVRSARDPDTVLATGRVVVCFVSTETRRPIHPPEQVQRALRNAEPPSKEPLSRTA
jgi:acyl-CoA thioester hydrolase